MYFPYLRGKQFEIVALRESIDLLKTSQRIIPIIEPVKEKLSSIVKLCSLFAENEIPLVLIYNPLVGDFKQDNEALKEKFFDSKIQDYDNYYIGYVISEQTDIANIQLFIDSYKENNICFLHSTNYGDFDQLLNVINTHNKVKYNLFIENNLGQSYLRRFKEFKNVIITDGFIPRKNEDYPLDEFFTDWHSIYREYNYVGFGDYLIVGDKYSDTGGPAYTVAIHLTFRHKNGDIWVKHFLSDSDKGLPINIQGKFAEALDKLIEFIDENDIIVSKAIGDFRNLHSTGHFPGLGYIKKLSMIHHLELINSLLS